MRESEREREREREREEREREIEQHRISRNTREYTFVFTALIKFLLCRSTAVK